MIYEPSGLEKRPVLSWQKIGADIVRATLPALIILTVMNLFFPRYYVMGHSMDPQLHPEDRLFATSIDVLTRSISRGAVVTLTSPRDGASVIKRIIGLPGETIEIYGGQVYIDGQPLREDYINERPTYTGTWHLNENQYFVLGDNRNRSIDSADYGPVNYDLIHGVVKFRFWPIGDFEVFSTPDYEE
jgi:signal peptidase I